MSVFQTVRISIRWLPEPASEPTDVLVFDVGDWFMDLRVNKADDSIDWAMAGTKEILSKEPLRCRWTKLVDSRGPSEPDEAEFVALPNGDDLETGSMPRPDKNNEVTPYEEIWRAKEPLAGPKRAWILQSVSNEGKSFIGRIGGTFMAFKQGESGSFTIRREELVDGDNATWKTIHAVGCDSVPSLLNSRNSEFEDESQWKAGDVVKVEGDAYSVRAFETI